MIIQDKKPAGLYLHIPFCQNKCGYCDFYSINNTDEQLLEQYSRAVINEIRAAAAPYAGTPVATVFMGGGTPSLLSPRSIKSIIEQIRVSFALLPAAEITIEANPATVTADKIEEYLGSGINRFSLGAQSFSNEDLSILGRLHDAGDILQTVELFHKKGVKNFNLDLIYGIPGQSIEKWKANLKTAVSLQPAHLSAYLLQLEPETPMGRQAAQGIIELAGEETEALMYENTIDILSSLGFRQYEISNFSRPGFECRHNLIYWRGENYLGFGPGAVSYMGNKRSINKPELFSYIKNLNSGLKQDARELEVMTPRQQLADAVILGLRLCQGIDVDEINQRFSLDIVQEYGQVINNNMQKGLLSFNNGRLFLTRPAYFLSNEVLCQFIA